MAAPRSSAQATTDDFMLSIETGAPRATTSAKTGSSRRSSSSAVTGCARVGPGGFRADIDDVGALGIIARACASARSGAMNSPPSEKESG
jgi:hypothetical protein